jgi:hypothetical protein
VGGARAGGVVIVLIRLLVFVILHGGVVQESYAPHYAPGLMAKVSRNRDMPPVACMISSAQYEIGDWLWIYGKRTETLLHCRVTDVSHPTHRQGHIDRRRLVELSYEVTRALCGTTKGSSIECPVLIIRTGER